MVISEKCLPYTGGGVYKRTKVGVYKRTEVGVCKRTEVGVYKRIEVGVYKLLNSISKKASPRFRSRMVSL